jgi:hypothetical protein
MSDPSNDIPRSAKLLQVFWPILFALMIGGASMVRADAQIDQVEVRVDDLTKNGAPVIRERLARMEEKQDALAQTMMRIEGKIDDLDTRSRERNLNGL